MKCIIGNANLANWCRAIHCLTQIGDNEVFLDFSDRIVTLSTTNLACTSFATFLFFKPFFASYSMDSAEPEKVTLASKIILNPYRTQRVAKSYLQSEISYNPDDDYVTVKSEGKSRVVTTYKLSATSVNDEIALDTDPDSLPHCLRGDAKVLTNCLSNFTHVKGLAEITLKIQGQKVILRNTVTDLAKKDGSVVTEYNLSSYDFIDYEVPPRFTTELAFGFREFKIFTAFAEALKAPVTIHFEEDSKPVIFTVKTELFEARLCMATKDNDPFTTSIRSGGSQPQGSLGRISNVSSANATPVSVEVNRQNIEKRASESVDEISGGNDQIQPPSKRLRRTEVEAPVSVEVPVADSPEPSPPPPADQNEEEGDCPDINPTVPILIGPLVEEMERRKNSVAYKSLQLFLNAPKMTEEEYLKTLPGHDIILCPASDEED